MGGSDSREAGGCRKAGAKASGCREGSDCRNKASGCRETDCRNKASGCRESAGCRKASGFRESSGCRKASGCRESSGCRKGSGCRESAGCRKKARGTRCWCRAFGEKTSQHHTLVPGVVEKEAVDQRRLLYKYRFAVCGQWPTRVQISICGLPAAYLVEFGSFSKMSTAHHVQVSICVIYREHCDEEPQVGKGSG